LDAGSEEGREVIHSDAEAVALNSSLTDTGGKVLTVCRELTWPNTEYYKDKSGKRWRLDEKKIHQKVTFLGV
jgi:hypothetical protein